MAASDKAVIDQVSDGVEPEKDDGEMKSPTTETGLPVEEQLRKEWDPNTDGGLPTP